MDRVRQLGILAKRYLRLAMGLVLVAVALLGCVLVLATANAIHRESVMPVLVRDVGIGLIVAAIVTFAVDLYANARLRLDVATDVMEAIFQRLIPWTIWSEVRDNVLRARVICHDWELSIQVQNPQVNDVAAEFEKQKGPGVHLIHYTAQRTIENITDTAIDYTIMGAVDADLNLPDRAVPRFTNLTVTELIGAQEPTTIFEESTMLALLTSKEQHPKAKVGDVALSYERNKEIIFSVTRRIPASRTVFARYEAWRGVRSPGLFVYTVGVLADGIRVEVSGDNVECDVMALHPDAAAMEHRSLREWRLNKGILPGQGVQIRFIPAKPKIETKIVSAPAKEPVGPAATG